MSNTFKVVVYHVEPIEPDEIEKNLTITKPTKHPINSQMAFKVIKDGLTWEEAKALRKLNKHAMIVEDHKVLKEETPAPAEAVVESNVSKPNSDLEKENE